MFLPQMVNPRLRIVDLIIVIYFQDGPSDRSSSATTNLSSQFGGKCFSNCENRDSINKKVIQKELKKEPRGRNHGNGDQIHGKQFTKKRGGEHVS